MGGGISGWPVSHCECWCGRGWGPAAAAATTSRHQFRLIIGTRPNFPALPLTSRTVIPSTYHTSIPGRGAWNRGVASPPCLSSSSSNVIGHILMTISSAHSPNLMLNFVMHVRVGFLCTYPPHSPALCLIYVLLLPSVGR